MQTKKAAAEVRKLKAEAREAQANAAKAEDLAAQQSLQRAKEERAAAAVLAGDSFQRVYRFSGAVTDVSARACMGALTEWHRLWPGQPMEVIFTSPGGSIIDGMALFDHISWLRREGHHMTTSTLGLAASMAGILLQAGDQRVMGKEAWLMIHEASFGAQGKTGEIEDTVEWVKKVQERILDIFAARSNMTKTQIKNKWTRKDWWISSDEALNLGLIDEIR